MDDATVTYPIAFKEHRAAASPYFFQNRRLINVILTGILLTCVMQDELDTWNNISPGTSSLPALGGKTARRARKNTDLSFLPRNQHQQGDSSPAKRGQDSTRDAALWSRRRLSATGPRRSLHRDKKIQARALALVGRFLVGSGGDSTRSGPCAARPT